MRPVTLADGRLLLRPPVPADADAVLRACQDPDIARWIPIPQPYTAADALAWVTVEAPASWAADRHLVWYACDPAAPEVPLVSVGLHHLDLEGGIGEVGYWAAPGARGRGLTTDAVRMVCRFAFDELGLDRVEWVAAVGNDASWRVAEKVGFRFEATARGRMVLHGRREDSWLAGLLPGGLVAGPAVEVRPGPEPAARAEDTGGAASQIAAEPPRPPLRDIEITAGALHLRQWRPEDAADVAAVMNDPRIAQWNPFTRTDASVEQDAADFIARRNDDDASHVSFAVVDATTAAFLGCVALHHLDRDLGNAEAGYWTAPAARGRGVATQALGVVSRWAFGALGLERLELFHALGNEASCGVADRAGYRCEGTLRSSYRYGDGLRHDEHLHARLAGDPEPS